MRYSGRVTSFQRARSPESKRQRAEALVDAARTLARERGVASVTLTAIADQVGVHHSAMRRYFPSHKHVLLRLAADGWASWANAVAEELRGRTVSPAELAEVLVACLAADPLLCDLFANVPLHLEHDVDVDHVVEFKRGSRQAIDVLTAAIGAATPSLAATAIDVVTAANALAATLWQVTHPGAELAAAYRADASLSIVGPGDFTPTLTRLLAATCAGLAAAPLR